MARVILGVTGGIAAYKACELCRLLVKAGHEVTPILTAEAERFVGVHTFEALARREAPRDLYPHLTGADLLVVAPLSANTLAKLAGGHADNVLTQLALAFSGPILAAPAMNARMWAHPATQANAQIVTERGIELIGPEEGELAEGELGLGRMSEPDAIFARAEEILGAAGTLDGRHVVVSAGGTREPLDTVRYLGNRSSGRMGVAVAEEAARRGAHVTLLAANVSIPRRAADRDGDDPDRRRARARGLRAGWRRRHRHGRCRRRLQAGRRGDSEAQEGRQAVDGHAGADRGHPGRARPPPAPGPGARRLRSRRGSGGARAGPREARAQAREPLGLQRRIPFRHRFRRRR